MCRFHGDHSLLNVPNFFAPPTDRFQGCVPRCKPAACAFQLRDPLSKKQLVPRAKHAVCAPISIFRNPMFRSQKSGFRVQNSGIAPRHLSFFHETWFLRASRAPPSHDRRKITPFREQNTRFTLQYSRPDEIRIRGEKARSHYHDILRRTAFTTDNLSLLE